MRRTKNNYKLPHNEQAQQDLDLHCNEVQGENTKAVKRIRKSKYSNDESESSNFKWLLIVVLLGLTYIYLQADNKKNQGQQSKHLLIQNEKVEPTKQAISKSIQQMKAINELETSANQKFIALKDLKEKMRIIQKQNKNDTLQKYLNLQIKKILKKSRYYDIHSFISDQHTIQLPKIISKYEARKQYDFNVNKRPVLQIYNSFQHLQVIKSQMMYPPWRPQHMPDWQIYKSQTKQQIDLTYFYYSLNLHPSNKNYLEAEFFHLDQLYNIGIYEKQLPLCVVAVGQNNVKSLIKFYESVRRQNYTNYHIVHIDDNSNDKTIQLAVKYFQYKPEFKQKITLIQQNVKKNALYNRNFAIQNYCNEDQIVIDIDADDWLIGRQVFQLVNSIYQGGNIYRGKMQEIWATYFSNIGEEGCCPHANAVGTINETVLQSQSYRSEGKWRTTQLRTFLKKIYNKIDKNDFVDKLMPKEGDFFVQASDSFIHNAIIQMSGLKHIKIIDQFPYFYSGSPPKTKYPDAYYSQFASQILPPYNQLEYLNMFPTRNKNYLIKQQKINKFQQKRKQTLQKRNKLKTQIYKLLMEQIKRKQLKEIHL